MQTRPLGRSDIRITPIGLGAWQFSEGAGLVGGFWPALSAEETEAVVRVTLESGINWFDTAEAYGRGKSEAALARALHALGKQDDEVVVATKWWPALRTASSITDTIGDRLRHLDGYSIDLHQIHQQIGSFSSHEKQLEAMARLVKDGRIRTVGVSNFSARRMREAHAVLAAHDIPLVSNQMPYSLFDRRLEAAGVMEAAKELGVTIIAYSPLAQGLLTGKFHDDRNLRPAGIRKYMGAFRAKGLARTQPVIDALKEIAERHDATPAQVALNWLVSFHGETVVAIPGASKVRQAEQNAGAVSFELTESELARLDELTRPYLEKAALRA